MFCVSLIWVNSRKRVTGDDPRVHFPITIPSSGYSREEPPCPYVHYWSTTNFCPYRRTKDIGKELLRFQQKVSVFNWRRQSSLYLCFRQNPLLVLKVNMVPRTWLCLIYKRLRPPLRPLNVTSGKMVMSRLKSSVRPCDSFGRRDSETTCPGWIPDSDLTLLTL